MGRRTNLALAGLVTIALATGLVGFFSGGNRTSWVLLVHGIAGLAIVLLAPWKSLVVRRGLSRARPDATASIVLALTVVVAVGAGVIHSTGLWHERGPWSAMSIHVVAGLATIPPLVWHIRRRPQRLRRTDLSRRTVLRGGAVVGGAVVIRAVTRDDLRFTGSYEVGSYQPDRMPTVQWFDDRSPALDETSWQLMVNGRPVPYQRLVDESHELEATLDCTGGWFSTQRWRGVALDTLLGDDPGGRSIVVSSATGYGRRFPLGDADRLLLATHIGGQPLSRGHGFPARLVAPGRRGLWWVKWVTEIRTSDRPWWLQSPVPLS